MWHTSRGDRTLRGQEAALIRAAIDTMIDALMDHVDDEFEDASAATGYDSGIAVYDAFSPSQQIGLLYDVAKHLLTDTKTTLELSAPLEATVAAIFVEARDQVAIEIDFHSCRPRRESEPTWREMVLAAYRSVFADATEEADAIGNSASPDELTEDDSHAKLPDRLCSDIHVWERLVDGLTDAILWDRDFEMSESFLDVDPGVSHHRRRLLGISEDYFSSVAPDPRPNEVFGLVSRTRQIVRARPR
jgi:hypothetical protein